MAGTGMIPFFSSIISFQGIWTPKDWS